MGRYYTREDVKSSASMDPPLAVPPIPPATDVSPATVYFLEGAQAGFYLLVTIILSLVLFALAVTEYALGRVHAQGHEPNTQTFVCFMMAVWFVAIQFVVTSRIIRNFRDRGLDEATRVYLGLVSVATVALIGWSSALITMNYAAARLCALAAFTLKLYSSLHMFCAPSWAEDTDERDDDLDDYEIAEGRRERLARYLSEATINALLVAAQIATPTGG